MSALQRGYLLRDSAGEHGFGILTRHVLVDALCLAAATAEQALEFACKTSAFWASAGARLVHDAQLLWVQLQLPTQPQPITARECLELISPWLKLVERVAPGAERPHRMCLPSLSGECRSELRARLHCGLQFDAPALRLGFLKAELSRPNPAADEGLVNVLSRFAEERIASSVKSRGTTEMVRHYLASVAEQGQASAEDVASALGVSVRTLHRRLRAEKNSYRKILREFRLDRCKVHLSVTACSAKEVAFTLGFGSPASFHRAFRQWTGCTVGEYRQREFASAGDGLVAAVIQEKA